MFFCFLYMLRLIQYTALLRLDSCTGASPTAPFIFLVHVERLNTMSGSPRLPPRRSNQRSVGVVRPRPLYYDVVCAVDSVARFTSQLAAAMVARLGGGIGPNLATPLVDAVVGILIAKAAQGVRSSVCVLLSF